MRIKDNNVIYIKKKKNLQGLTTWTVVSPKSLKSGSSVLNVISSFLIVSYVTF